MSSHRNNINNNVFKNNSCSCEFLKLVIMLEKYSLVFLKISKPKWSPYCKLMKAITRTKRPNFSITELNFKSFSNN